jgi:hypothetical protein
MDTGEKSERALLDSQTEMLQFGLSLSLSAEKMYSLRIR